MVIKLKKILSILLIIIVSVMHDSVELQATQYLALAQNAFTSDIDLTNYTIDGSIEYFSQKIRSGGGVTLTNDGGQASSIFLKDQMSRISSENPGFSTYFTMDVKKITASPADGFYFVIAKNSSGLGSTGGGLGYQGITNSLGVEFDFYDNGSESPVPNSDVFLNGVMYNTRGTSIGPNFSTTYSSGAIYTFHVWIELSDVGATNTLSVRVNNSSTRPSSATYTKTNLDLSSISDYYYTGFTAATGGSASSFVLTSWYFANEYISTGIVPSQTSFSVDSTGPTAPSVNSNSNGFIEIDGSTDLGSGVSGYQYKFSDQSTWNTYTSPFNPNRTGTLQSRAVDNVGNFSDMTSKTIYQLTLNYQDGRSNQNYYYTGGSSRIALTNPIRNYYSFLEWNSLSTGLGDTYGIDIVSMPSNNLTLYAQWLANSYTITFDVNGGTDVSPLNALYGSLITAPTAPTKTGYTFDGWYSDQALTQVYTFNTMPTDLTLYAKWNPAPFTISFEENGGSVVNSITQNYLTIVNEPNNPVKSGYTFGGWYTDDGSFEQAFTFSSMPASNTTLYAKWTPISYGLTYVLNGGEATNPSSYNFETPTFSIQNPTKEGYTFTGWTISEADGTYSSITIPQGSNVFLPNVSYRININDNGHTYQRIDQRGISWLDARTACGEAGGYLVTTTTQAEWSFIATIVGSGYYWLGGSDINQEGNWQWENGEGAISAGYQAWASGEPNNWGGNEDYLVSWGSANWNDLGENSSNVSGYVCEFDQPTITSNTLTANYAINSYQLNFNVNGGTSVSNQTKVFNSTITLPATSKVGYVFEGWYQDVGLTQSFELSNMPASNVTLYAKWRLDEITFSFITNGGNTINNIVQQGNTALTPPTPTKTGYRFDGWFKDANLTITFDESEVFLTNQTLYAKWTINPYTITFNTDGGTSIDAITQDYNTPVTAPSAPTKVGYTFSGWDQTIPSTVPATDMTITALWTINPYTITFNTDGGTSIDVITQDYNTPVTAPSAPTKVGYTFSGWDQTIPSTVPATDMTITALWTINPYTITFNTDGGTSIDVITQDYNTPVTAPSAPTKVGYTFSGWDQTIPSTVPATDMTITALWTINSYQVEFIMNEGEDIETLTLNYNSPIEVTPLRTGYSFTGFYVDEALTILFESMLVPAENLTLYTSWQINNYSMTFLSNNGSLINTIIKPYLSTVLEPTSPEREGYTFDGWFRDELLTLPYVFTVIPAENIVLYAKWQVNQYPITLIGMTDEPVSAMYDYNLLAVLPNRITKDGYVFGGWYKDESFTQKVETLRVPARETLLYAKWMKASYTLTIVNGEEELVSSVLFEDTIIVPDLVREGYEFSGLFKNLNDIAPFDGLMPSQPLTLYVKWTALEFELSFNTDGGTDIVPMWVPFEQFIPEFEMPTKDGFVLLGFETLDGSKVDVSTWTMPAQSVELLAIWEGALFNLTLVSGEATTVIPVKYDTPLILPNVNAPVGYEHIGWSSTENSLEKEDIMTMPMQDITLYPVIVPQLFDVEYYIEGIGFETVSFQYGSLIEMPTPTKEGHRFIQFTYRNGEPFVSIPMPDQTISLVALFERLTYSISYDSQGGTTVSNLTSIVFGSPIQAPTAPTRTGYEFYGWFERNSDVMFEFTTMPGKNVTLYAAWTPIRYNITYHFNNDTGIDVHTIGFNEPITKPEDPVKVGFDFSHWTKDYSTNVPYTRATMENQSFDLYAVYIPKQQVITVITNDFNIETALITAQPFDLNLSISLPAGYRFLGWFTQPFGQGQHITEETPIENGEQVYVYPFFDKIDDQPVSFTNLFGMTRRVNQQKAFPVVNVVMAITLVSLGGVSIFKKRGVIDEAAQK
jgi:uncharacterized repeat protein (TIGR02543 family)